MQIKVLIAIPAYRCEAQIRRVLSGLSGIRHQIPQVQQVIVFDNQSPDQTSQAAQEQIAVDQSSSWIQVRVNEVNRGLGGTQKVAFHSALSGDYTHLIVLHGDDQADVNDLPAMMKAFQSPYDAVLGSRFMKGSCREGYSVLRTWGNRGLNLAYTTLTGHRVLDLGSGLNGFRASALKDLPFDQYADHFTFNMDLLLGLIESRKTLLFQPIHWREFDQVSNAKTFSVGWKALMTLLRWKFRSRPKKVS